MSNTDSASNLDLEQAECLECGSVFEPTKRWGSHPGLYRRCEVCRDHRVWKKKKAAGSFNRSYSKAYLKVRDYFWLQAKYGDLTFEMGDTTIATATQITIRTVKRVVQRMRGEGFLSTETFRIKLASDKWINRRTITLAYLPPGN